MSTAKRCGRWQGGGVADSTDVRQDATNTASGILIDGMDASPRQRGLHDGVGQTGGPSL